MKKRLLAIFVLAIFMTSCKSDKRLVDYVNPLLGTATLWETE